MTKFDQLKRYILRKKTFNFGEMNLHFKNKRSSLNSYTTYLNTLVRSGVVVKAKGRGMYRVRNPERLKNATHSDLLLRGKVVALERKLKEQKKDHRSWVGHFHSEIGQLKSNIKVKDEEIKHLNFVLANIPPYPASEKHLNEIFEKVKKAIREQLANPALNVFLQSTLMKDLNMDDLDVVELIMSLEQEFLIEISDEEAGAYGDINVEQLVSLINKAKEKK